MFLLLSADFFTKSTFKKKSFWNTFRVSHGLGPNQDRCFVGSNLGPNCLQMTKVMLASNELIPFLHTSPIDPC